MSITFEQQDQPKGGPSRCLAVVVLDPIVSGCRLRKVLVDGDSVLNLIYEDTLDKMHLDKSSIEESYTTFKGIIPRKEVWCSGKITLDVVFGNPENDRSEELTFHTMPFQSGYHALLGRDDFSNFHDIHTMGT